MSQIWGGSLGMTPWCCCLSGFPCALTIQGCVRKDIWHKNSTKSYVRISEKCFAVVSPNDVSQKVTNLYDYDQQIFHICTFFSPFIKQDNFWKFVMNKINQTVLRAFDMTFIIGQKSYDRYEYYDFFSQVFQRLKGQPFQTNLTSESEVSGRRWNMQPWISNKYVFTQIHIFSHMLGQPIFCLSAWRCASLCHGAKGSAERWQRSLWWPPTSAETEKQKQHSLLW